jgi:hypothetical protein
MTKPKTGTSSTTLPKRTGTCTYCQKTFAKSGMIRHLASCPSRKAAIQQAESQGKGNPQTLFHLRIQDAYRDDFWLDLEAKSTTKLSDLDQYLRVIWLECCGHLSKFSTEQFGDVIAMTRTIGTIAQTRPKLHHTYDYGTPSETRVTIVGERVGQPLTRHAIALMARNTIPPFTCIVCGQPATRLCLECLVEEETWGSLCEQHADNPEHQGYGEPIPLVNSPRLGMCGYEGPADPPY